MLILRALRTKHVLDLRVHEIMQGCRKISPMGGASAAESPETRRKSTSTAEDFLAVSNDGTNPRDAEKMLV